jgi:hypothetical protein
MKFKIINLSDGSQKDCSFQDLSKFLSPNCIILRVKEEGFESIGLVTHHTLVFFAVEFANYALQNYTDKIIPEAQTCIDLTRKWLEDQSSVSEEELCDIASDASDTADYLDDCTAAYYAVNAAGNAAEAAYAASNYANAASNYAYAANAASNYAYYAADAASNYAYAAGNAAEAAYAAIDAVEDIFDEQNRQATFILNFFGVE